jgi:molybdenum cofactor cytidylyltransferase
MLNINHTRNNCLFILNKIGRDNMPQGIILAAGYSSRTSSNKLLLEVDGKSLIYHAILSMQPYVEHIYVITGHYHESILEHLMSLCNVTCIKNDDYPKGMFTSVVVGAKMTNKDFFVLPGDCPFVSKETYQKLLSGTKKIRVPSYQGRKGHPIWIDDSLRELLIQTDLSSNLKVFRDHVGYEDIPVLDPNILVDIDTEEIYRKVIDTKQRSD